MIPRWHILFGAIFTLLIWFFAPNLNWIYLILLFLSSFLIDFDHYVNVVIKTKKLSLFHSFRYHDELQKIELQENKKGLRRKGDFHLFHTVEFHIFVGLLGIFWIGFFYIFIGMVFHSLLDLFWLLQKDRFYRREYFLFNWIKNNKN